MEPIWVDRSEGQVIDAENPHKRELYFGRGCPGLPLDPRPAGSRFDGDCLVSAST
jgi:hypothetical protein